VSGERRDPAAPSDAPTRLARRLGLADAVVLGLGAMIGAGVFAAIAPAAAAAGDALLVGLAIAGAVAYANATSSARLAALHPQAGGTYVYGRERLGPFWGFLAGWCFVVGKLASAAAMAMTFASYAAPALSRPLALSAIVAVTGLNALGVRKTAIATRVVVAVVLAALAIVVVAIWLGGAAEPGRLRGVAVGTPYDVLRAAAFLFFAFAGYARLATLGEEVADPRRTIPRAIPIALGITLAIYAIVAVSALAGAGAEALAASPAPLATAVERGRLGWLSPVVRLGATVASLGVLVSLLVGISRTVFAMSANGELPRALSAVHPRTRAPLRAEIAVGAAATLVLLVAADVGSAIGFSSFAVLGYYAITNAAAWTLGGGAPRILTGFGLAGCLALAATLPATSVASGIALLGAGAAVHAARRAPSPAA
jgi:basic amino acid/polyamine antiporter, APA family